MNTSGPVVVFDSGFGGISVLRRLLIRLPERDYLYFGDSANAPYGPKSAEEIRKLSCAALRPLLRQKPSAVVIACNTATALALESVREMAPGIPVLGIRPALRQAEEAGCRRILTLATAGTLASDSYARQLQQLSPGTLVRSVPAPEIVAYVEGGRQERDALVAVLRDRLLPVFEKGPDGVVLGCTHFPFAKEEIREALGRESRFFDAGEDVAEELARVLGCSRTEEETAAHGSVRFLNSRNTPSALRLAWTLLLGGG